MKILFIDEQMIIVDKPGGLLSVPGRTDDKKDCVVNTIKQIIPDIIEQPAVHRLDMYTSGIMVLARTSAAHRQLSKQFENRGVEKQYIALLEGIVKEDKGEIALRFRLDINNRPLQVYDPVNGKLGITQWKKLAIENTSTRIQFTPLTGRTHQLRVHAAHKLGLGIPIVGDYLYGNGKDGDPMLLHATKITFNHPLSSEKLTFLSPPPF